MNKLIIITSIATLSLTLVACSISSNSINPISALNETTEKMSSSWENGNNLVIKGNKLIKKGKEQIKDGEKQIENGQKQIQTGENNVNDGMKMIKKGKEIIQDTEDNYRNFLLKESVREQLLK